MNHFSVVLLLVATAIAGFGQAGGSPRISTVTPDTGAVSVEFTAAGENLGKASVAELYLTDGKNDAKVEVSEQTDASIKFKAPGTVKAGRYSLMILTGDRKQFIEQPVKLTIE